MPLLPPQANLKRKTLSFWLLVTVAFLPILYVIEHTIEGSRNLPYWDEYDSALDFIVGLQRQPSFTDKVTWFLSLSNEHRMLTSRMLFTLEHWLTGKLDFHFIGFVGNSFLFATCALLIKSMRAPENRLRLLVILAFLIFQLENYENFLWSGSSIDHYQVVFLAAGALYFLLNDSKNSFISACLFAILANYTLAHGTMVWPVGGVLLALHKRWNHLYWWAGMGALAMVFFFWDFHTNPGHRVVSFSYDGVAIVVMYWLKLLGAPIALGGTKLAPVMGAALLCLLGWQLTENFLRKPRFIAGLALFATLALLTISVGRAGLYNDGNHIPSRYLILGSLTWALCLFMLLEQWSSTERPYQLLAWSLPVLIFFNITANNAYIDRAYSFLEARDRAALRFKQHGVDGKGVFSLHPGKHRATRVLGDAKDAGIYAMPPICRLKEFSDVELSDQITFFLDEVDLSPRALSVRGWAGIPQMKIKRGTIHLLLKSETDTLVFTTVPMFRPDVSKALTQPGWRYSGFAFSALRQRIPEGEYELGILINTKGKKHYIMTGRRISLQDEPAPHQQVAITTHSLHPDTP